MSFIVPKIVGEIEMSDNFHLSRLLILLYAVAGEKDKACKGITKLAKLDFLARYPNCLKRVLELNEKKLLKAKISESELNTIESKMIRFKYGPWDARYRRWIGLMVSKGLAITYVEGRTIMVKLTIRGNEVAKGLSENKDFELIKTRSDLIAKTVGIFSAKKLMEYIYQTFPEILSLKYGEEITL